MGMWPRQTTALIDLPRVSALARRRISSQSTSISSTVVVEVAGKGANWWLVSANPSALIRAVASNSTPTPGRGSVLANSAACFPMYAAKAWGNFGLSILHVLAGDLQDDVSVN